MLGGRALAPHRALPLQREEKLPLQARIASNKKKKAAEVLKQTKSDEGGEMVVQEAVTLIAG